MYTYILTLLKQPVQGTKGSFEIVKFDEFQIKFQTKLHDTIANTIKDFKFHIVLLNAKIQQHFK